jgi:hypothetical protein
MSDYEHLLDLDADDDIPPSMIDLEKIPRRVWDQVLAPLRWQERSFIAQQVRDARLRDLASRLAAEMDMAECRRRIAAAEARFFGRHNASTPPAGTAQPTGSTPPTGPNARITSAPRPDNTDPFSPATSSARYHH